MKRIPRGTLSPGLAEVLAMAPGCVGSVGM
jgi:hypothetical protein